MSPAALATLLVAALSFQGDPATDINAAFYAWLKTPNDIPKVAAKVVRREYSWLDATPAITVRDGVKYRDPAIAPWSFSITAAVDEARAAAVERHFGAPLSTIQFSFTSEEEKRRLQRLENGKLAHHGMRVVASADGSFGNLEVDYQWLVDNARTQVAPVSQAILAETDRVLRAHREGRVVTTRDKVAAIFRFIQSIPYERIDDLPDGKDRCGLRTPLTTLLKGGDCDSKSALMAALIRAKAIADVVIVTVKAREGTGHALVGIRIDAHEGEQVLVHDGKSFVLAEAATEDSRRDGNLADLGEVGPDWRDFRSRPFEVTPVK